MRESWSRIDRWLTANTPATAAQVNPPATAEEAAALETAIGRALPEELTQWLRQANGMDERAMLLPQSYAPLSVEGVLACWKICVGIAPGPDDSDVRDALGKPAGSGSFHFLDTFVPVGRDIMGYALIVDLRNGPRHGCVMEWDSVHGADNPPLWSGVGAMLTDVAEALEHSTPAGAGVMQHYGTPSSGHVAVITDDGELEWHEPPGNE